MSSPKSAKPTDKVVAPTLEPPKADPPKKKPSKTPESLHSLADLILSVGSRSRPSNEVMRVTTAFLAQAHRNFKEVPLR